MRPVEKTTIRGDGGVRWVNPSAGAGSPQCVINNNAVSLGVTGVTPNISFISRIYKYTHILRLHTYMGFARNGVSPVTPAANRLFLLLNPGFPRLIEGHPRLRNRAPPQFNFLNSLIFLNYGEGATNASV